MSKAEARVVEAALEWKTARRHRIASEASTDNWAASEGRKLEASAKAKLLRAIDAVERERTTAGRE